MNIESLKQFLAGISAQESFFFLGFLAGAFLIGFILAWVIWGSRSRKYRKLMAQKDSALSETEIEDMRHTLTEREKLIEELDAELKALKLKQNSSIEDQAVIEALKRDNSGLLAQIKTLKGEIQAMEQEQASTNESGDAATISTQLDARLAQIEEKLSAIQLGTPEQEQLSTSNEAAETNPSPIEDDGQQVSDAKQLVLSSLGTTIPKATPDDRDDLKLINGIGPFLEQQLNDIGFYTFSQLAALDKPTGKALAVTIGYLPERVAKDGWVRQARHFNVLKQEDPNALKRIAEYPTDITDLQIFKGIGSKEEDLLKSNGYHNWEDIAQAGFDDVNKLLGELLESKFTSTLSQQAQMAVEGKWEKLKAFQDFLN